MFRIGSCLGVTAAAALASAAPVSAEVVESSAGHFVTRNSATVKATPKAAWLALIEPAEWWDDEHTWSGSAANLSIVPQAGGCFCERIPEKEGAADVGLAGSAQHMTVVMADPARVLRMRGALGPLQSEPADGVLSVTLQPVAGGGTKVVWEYVVGGHLRYPVEKISKAVDEVMSQQLGGLADKLGRTDTPAKPAATPAAKAPAETNPGSDTDADAVGEATSSVGEAIDALRVDKGL